MTTSPPRTEEFLVQRNTHRLRLSVVAGHLRFTPQLFFSARGGQPATCFHASDKHFRQEVAVAVTIKHELIVSSHSILLERLRFKHGVIVFAIDAAND